MPQRENRVKTQSSASVAGLAKKCGETGVGDTSRCPSGRRPIDLVHLAAQTGGDRLLEREVLVLLRTQLVQIASRLENADAKVRQTLAHGLKGAALNMGAFPLAAAAAALEYEPLDDTRFEALTDAIAATRQMVDHLIS